MDLSIVYDPQKEWLQGDMLVDQLAYWKKQLENAPAVLTLPTDRPRPAVQTYGGAVQPFALSKCLTDNLKALSRQEEVTLYMTLVAAFQTLLHRYTGQDDILIGAPVAGRTRSEIENPSGSCIDTLVCINTLVLRADLSGNPTFRELLGRVREVILEAYAHQDVPFEYLIKELQLERNVAQNPLFQVMLTLEPPSPVFSPGWTLTQMNVDTKTSKFDLSLELDDQPEGLIGRFEYSTDLFDAATIQRMVGHWQTLLEGIVADTGQRLGELPLLTAAERHQQLVEWNPTDAEYPKDKCSLLVSEPTAHTAEDTYVAPTLMVYYQLVQIWEELLDARPIGIRDNFFYLGGHSLLATRLVHRIEQVCGKKLPLATLFAGPTIEQLANALQQQEDARARVPLVAVQADGSNRPFFYLHGDWNSSAFYCFTVAHDLGSDQPFYALEPCRFDGLRVVPTFEAMASAHIEVLRTVQPEGPYLLGGWCNGAFVAYEMAQQLHASGQTVDLLVLMDAGSVPALARLVGSFIRRIGNLLRISQDKQLDCFLRLRHLYNYGLFSHYRKPPHFSLFPPAEALHHHWIDIFDWVASDYVPRPYPGKITFFWANEAPLSIREPWREVAKATDVEVHIIPGTHMTSRTDYVHDLAKFLSKCLNRAQEG